MSIYRIGILLTAAVLLLVIAGGCKSLALSGARKYKVDLTNALLNIQTAIETDGVVKQGEIDKLDQVLTKYEPEFGNKGSFSTSKRILESLKKVVAENPPNAFQLYRSAISDIAGVNELLKTEVD